LRRASQGNNKAKVFGGLNVPRVELEGSFQPVPSFRNAPRSELRGGPIIPNFTRLSSPQRFLEATDGLLISAPGKQLDAALMGIHHGYVFLTRRQNASSDRQLLPGFGLPLCLRPTIAYMRSKSLAKLSNLLERELAP
jgi:hypothetical protein